VAPGKGNKNGTPLKGKRDAISERKNRGERGPRKGTLSEKRPGKNPKGHGKRGVETSKVTLRGKRGRRAGRGIPGSVKKKKVLRGGNAKSRKTQERGRKDRGPCQKNFRVHPFKIMGCT